MSTTDNLSPRHHQGNGGGSGNPTDVKANPLFWMYSLVYGLSAVALLLMQVCQKAGAVSRVGGLYTQSSLRKTSQFFFIVPLTFLCRLYVRLFTTSRPCAHRLRCTANSSWTWETFQCSHSIISLEHFLITFMFKLAFVGHARPNVVFRLHSNRPYN